MIWEAGQVRAPAHEPLQGDLEPVLAALGGAMPLCLAVLDAWPVLSDGTLLPLLHRMSGTHPGPALCGPQAGVDELEYWLRPLERRAEVFRSLSTIEQKALRDFYARADRHDRALAVGSMLPPAFEAMRLAAAVERADHGHRDQLQLDAAVARLARECCEAAAIDPPLQLPLTWAGRVWARGAALVDGNLVLDLRPPVSEAEPWQAITPSGTRPWVPT